MSVEVRLFGRLGNHLFQYALGRIIAEELGYRLRCVAHDPRPPEVLGSPLDCGPPAGLNSLSAHFPSAPLSISGNHHPFPVESHELNANSGWTAQTVDLDAILADRSPRQIRLAGWFQRLEYFQPRREKIRIWLRPAPLPAHHTPRAQDVLVSIRRGADYGISGWTVPVSFYERALSSLADVGRVYICGTGIDEVVRARLAHFHPVYVDGPPIEHFALSIRFRRFVLSNSTFAWWTAFLSDADEIIAPRFEAGQAYCFSGFNEVDLALDPEVYSEIAVENPAPFALFERTPTTPGPKFGSAAQRMADWLGEHSGPIAPADWSRHADGEDPARVLKELIDSGCLRLRPRYLES